jgi:hypothetical protein
MPGLCSDQNFTEIHFVQQAGRVVCEQNELVHQPNYSLSGIQADQADFEAFQDKVEKDRQAGLWFKKLHERKKPKDEKKV